MPTIDAANLLLRCDALMEATMEHVALDVSDDARGGAPTPTPTVRWITRDEQMTDIHVTYAPHLCMTHLPTGGTTDYPEHLLAAPPSLRSTCCVMRL